MTKKSKILLGAVLLVVALAAFSIWRVNKSGGDASYKPMIKVNNAIYYWDGDIDIDKKDLEKIGEIESSYENLRFNLNERSKNFSSNYFPVSTEIYRYDENSIIAFGEGYSAILRVIEEDGASPKTGRPR